MMEYLYKNISRGFKLKTSWFKHIYTIIILFLFAAGFSPLAAQTSDPDLNSYMNFAVIMFLSLVVLIFLGFIFLNDKEVKIKAENKKSLLSILLGKLSGAAPIEKENDIMLEHDFDGIKELDNDLPPWWKYLFYVTIVFAVVYLVNYHIISSNKLMADEYNEEVQIAEIQKAEMIRTGAYINEATVSLLKDVESVSKGKDIFTANCVTCHGSKGEGLVGPNLTDDYWIHGGGIKNVFTTIKYGVPAKGMLSWQTQLSPKQMQQVASYVLSLHGTNPPNAKPPDGVIYKEAADTTSKETKSM